MIQLNSLRNNAKAEKVSVVSSNVAPHWLRKAAQTELYKLKRLSHLNSSNLDELSDNRED
jgi:hypothetical protein